MFPQIEHGFEIIDEQIVYENLYHMECSECNVWPENEKTISKCSNCNEEFYNLSPKLNKRCLFCIWNHNKPLNKIINKYYPEALFQNSKIISDRFKIVIRKKIYISSSMLEFDMMAFNLLTMMVMNENQGKQNQGKQNKENKEENIPFGWNPIMKKNKNNNNKKKQKIIKKKEK